MKTLTVIFSVTGLVKQTIEVPDDVDPTEIQNGLDRGEILTTIQDGGNMIRGNEVIGTVNEVSNKTELEYFDFVVGEL